MIDFIENIPDQLRLQAVSPLFYDILLAGEYTNTSLSYFF